jgi:hypothetical protein
LAKVLIIAKEITDLRLRSRVLCTLASFVREDERLETYIQALSVAQKINDYSGNQLLIMTKIATFLPEKVQPQIFETIIERYQKIKHESTQGSLLRNIVQYLPEKYVIIFYSFSQSFNNAENRAETLIKLAPYLPMKQQANLYTDALITARTIEDPRDRSVVLASLIPYLPPEAIFEVCAEGLLAAEKCFMDEQRSFVISEFAEYLPAQLTNEALMLAQSIVEHDSRSWALGSLAPYLPPDLLPLALSAICSLNEGGINQFRERALKNISPNLAEHLSKRPQSPFHDCLRALSRDGRDSLLRSITVLTPWLTVLFSDTE